MVSCVDNVTGPNSASYRRKATASSELTEILPSVCGAWWTREPLNKNGEGFSGGYRGSFAEIPRLPGADSPDVPPSQFAPSGPLRALAGPAGSLRPDLGPLRPRQPVS